MGRALCCGMIILPNCGLACPSTSSRDRKAVTTAGSKLWPQLTATFLLFHPLLAPCESSRSRRATSHPCCTTTPRTWPRSKFCFCLNVPVPCTVIDWIFFSVHGLPLHFLPPSCAWRRCSFLVARASPKVRAHARPVHRTHEAHISRPLRSQVHLNRLALVHRHLLRAASASGFTVSCCCRRNGRSDTGAWRSRPLLGLDRRDSPRWLAAVPAASVPAVPRPSG